MSRTTLDVEPDPERETDDAVGILPGSETEPVTETQLAFKGEPAIEDEAETAPGGSPEDVTASVHGSGPTPDLDLGSPANGASANGEGPESREPGPELVIGLVTPIGTDTGELAKALLGCLADYNYTGVVLKLSRHLGTTTDGPLIGESEDHRVRRLIKAGDDFCRDHVSKELPEGDPAALARLAVREIVNTRLAIHRQDGRTEDAKILAETPLHRTAYIIHSLKRPDEVRLLREIYGKRFLLLASQGTLQERRDNLLGRPLGTPVPQEKEQVVSDLIALDAEEAAAVGQRVNQTYPLADYFMRDTDPSRIVKLLFGEPLAPNIGEFAMYLAHASRARSLAASRKVGAAIVKDGSVISTGYNDAPFGQEPDVVAGEDTSERLKRDNVRNTLSKLQEAGLLVGETTDPVGDDLVAQAMTALKGGDLLAVIEYQRAVHAEANAIDDATVRGVSPAGGTLYVTTYPCHLCYKHALSVRLGRIEYIEPYPKSRATAMYPEKSEKESKLVPYAGVAPLRYVSIFDEREPFQADKATGRFPVVDRRAAVPLNTQEGDDADVYKQERVAINGLQENYR